MVVSRSGCEARGRQKQHEDRHRSDRHRRCANKLNASARLARNDAPVARVVHPAAALLDAGIPPLGLGQQLALGQRACELLGKADMPVWIAGEQTTKNVRAGAVHL